MKHRQVAINRVGVLNPDGHAIGLDIGATAIRAAVLAPGMTDGRLSVTIHGSGQVPLAPGVVVNGEIREPAAVTLALKHLWSTNKIQCRNVILGMANPQVLVRDLTVPNLDAERRRKALPYQAKEVVALPIEEVVLDFCELGSPGADDATVDGVLIATPREPVVRAVAAVEKANLRVARVDLSSFGTLRAVGDEHLAVEAVIDLGAHLTTIVIHDHGIPRLVRTLARGGAQLTDSLADRMSMSAFEAEAAKCQFGLGDGPPEIVRAIGDGLRPLLAEIRTSIEYFRSGHTGIVLERISLTGGGSQLVGIADTLSEQLGLPARLVDPMQHIRNRHASREVRQAGSFDVASAVSLGLAMGAAA